MKSVALAAALALVSTAAFAQAEKFVLDASHSQVLFNYNHLGFSTTYGMFSGFEGDIDFDAENPDASSVSVSIPVKSMFTGWEKRDAHFLSADFFDFKDDDLVTFKSTSIVVTGDNTAKITGDLTLNDVVKSVTLDARLTKNDVHPIEKKPWLGFEATTVLTRSDFGLGAFAPAVSDQVGVAISIEAQKAE